MQCTDKLAQRFYALLSVRPVICAEGFYSDDEDLELLSINSTVNPGNSSMHTTRYEQISDTIGPFHDANT